MTLEQLFDKMTFTPSGERISGGMFAIVCESRQQWITILQPQWLLDLVHSRATDPHGNKWVYLNIENAKDLLYGCQISGAVFFVQPSWEEQGLAMMRARNKNGVSKYPVVIATQRFDNQEYTAMGLRHEYIE